MNYSEFLLSQLILQNIKEAKNTPYDILFIKVQEIYLCFIDSNYNIETKSEYDCMISYINKEYSFIENFIKY